MAFSFPPTHHPDDEQARPDREQARYDDARNAGQPDQAPAAQSFKPGTVVKYTDPAGSSDPAGNPAQFVGLVVATDDVDGMTVHDVLPLGGATTRLYGHDLTADNS